MLNEGIEDNIRDFIQRNNLDYDQYISQICEIFELEEDIAEELLNRFGVRDFIRSEAISLPMIDSRLTIMGPILNHYIDYLEESTPLEAWPKRKNDLLTSLGKINGFIETKETIRGLVIGDVQSGKTSNFLGLVANAIDTQIQVIIIISGTTNALRNQTQLRFDGAFGKYKNRHFINLTKADYPEIYLSLIHI